MAPITVGIIGLSSATTNISPSPGDGWAASAHVPYLLASPRYEITALCNSSVNSAQAAVKRHGLPPTTKTYGSPEDLAKDPGVDLVVCCVRVDKQYEVMMPVLKAGKHVFVEWPLGSNLQQAEKLLAAAKRSGSKTIVGLQGRTSPFIQKVKELVESKAIGELLSTNGSFDIGFLGDTEPPGVDYLAKKEVGGNLLTILFGHMADPVFHALGQPKELSALLTTRWPDTKLLHADGSFDKMIKRETPNHFMMQGILSNNAAPVSIFVTAIASISLALGGEKIELFDHEKGTVEEINVQYADEVKDLPPLAKNVGKLYELFATGAPVNEGMVDFEQAVGMHKIIGKMFKSSEERKYEKI